MAVSFCTLLVLCALVVQTTAYNCEDEPNPIWFTVFLIVYVVWCVASIGLALWMVKKSDWRRLTIRNTILWGIVVYLLLRGLFYSLFAAGVCTLDELPAPVYVFLVDSPMFVFLLIFTQLVVFWVQSVTPDVDPAMDWTSRFMKSDDDGEAEGMANMAKGTKLVYVGIVGLLGMMLVVDWVYRAQGGSTWGTDRDDRSEGAFKNLTATHVVYGCLISMFALMLSLAFFWYGLKFTKMLRALPATDVRRQRHESITKASIGFTVVFFVYGILVFLCYTLHLPYIPGTEMGFAEQQAVVYRIFDYLLISLMMFIVGHSHRRVNRALVRSLVDNKDMSAPLLINADAESGETWMAGPAQSPALIGTKPAVGPTAGASVDESRGSMISSPCGGSTSPPPLLADRITGLSQPLGEMRSPGTATFPYRERVLRHYDKNFSPDRPVSPAHDSTARASSAGSRLGS